QRTVSLWRGFTVRLPSEACSLSILRSDARGRDPTRRLRCHVRNIRRLFDVGAASLGGAAHLVLDYFSTVVMTTGGRFFSTSPIFSFSTTTPGWTTTGGFSTTTTGSSTTVTFVIVGPSL